MAATRGLADWSKRGFAREPELRVTGENGLLLYRCWGGNSSEWGTGYFSDRKPSSVSDAELRYNIVDWGNGIRQVSTFLLKPGVPYFIGPVAHGCWDLSIPAKQIYIAPPLEIKAEFKGREVLKQDATVFIPAGQRGQA